MSDLQAPALRISHIVSGRELRSTRVYYHLSALRPDGEKAVPETVVLHRWRHRRREGFAFSGTRLSPTVWRAVHTALGDDAVAICGLSAELIEVAVDRRRDVLRKRHLSLPANAALASMLAAIGPDALRALLGRHLTLGRKGQSGVPDLFLYARELATGRVAKPVFVEVKRPGERLSSDQKAELSFLQSLGLRARVLRLIER